MKRRLFFALLLIAAYAFQFDFGGVHRLQAAPPRSENDSSPGVPAVMTERAGSVSGFVSSEHAQDTTDLRLQLLQASGTVLRTERTDDAGGFTFYPVDGGVYRLQVLDRRGRLLGVENADALSFTLLDGQALALNLRLNAAPPDAASALAPDAVAATYQITGVLTAAIGGLPIANVTIDAYTLDNFFAQEVGTNAQGEFRMSSLVPGSYKLQFYTDPSSPAYVSQWYNNQSTFASATPVVVVAGTTTQNVNVALALGGRISGTVTAADTGLPLPTGSGGIQVYDANGGFAAYGIRDALGNYSTGGLSSGSYRVRFSAASNQPYLTVYYNNKATLTDGDLVSVTAPNVTTNINGALPAGRRSRDMSRRRTMACPLQMQTFLSTIVRVACGTM